jgi:hypothetical protein
MSKSRIGLGGTSRGGTERALYWQRHLDRWKRSDLSQAEFCRRCGLKAVTFSWWKKKLGAGAASNQERGGKRTSSRRRSSSHTRTSSPKWAYSGPGGSSTSDAKFVEVEVSDLPAAAYEVVLSRGVVIRLPPDFDPDKAAQLIAVVKTAC